MAIKIKKTNEVKTLGASMVLYAPSGTGKTTAIGTLPEGKTLIIDTEGGTRSIDNMCHDVVEVRSLPELQEALIICQRGKYKFIVIDSISELEKRVLLSRKDSKSKLFLSMKEYAETAEVMRTYVRKISDLKKKGMFIVFTALEMTNEVTNDEEENTKRCPLVSKKFYEEFCGIADLVCRLTIKGKTGERRLSFVSNSAQMGKSRISVVSPDEPADLTSLFRKIYDGKVVDVDTKGKTSEARDATKEQMKAIGRLCKAYSDPSGMAEGNVEKELQSRTLFEVAGKESCREITTGQEAERIIKKLTKMVEDMEPETEAEKPTKEKGKAKDAEL